MKQDISMLIKRSNEIQAALSERHLTREEARWGAKIALAGLPENELDVPRWRRKWSLRVRRLMQPT